MTWCGSLGVHISVIMVCRNSDITIGDREMNGAPQMAPDAPAQPTPRTRPDSPGSGALTAVNARPQTAPDGRMSDGEYRAGMDVVAAAVRILLLVPVDQLRVALEHAETLGPILEPTAYVRGGGDNLRDQREILDAAAALVAVAERVGVRAGLVRS